MRTRANNAKELETKRYIGRLADLQSSAAGRGIAFRDAIEQAIDLWIEAHDTPAGGKDAAADRAPDAPARTADAAWMQQG
jgi:hypothetical protein